MKRARIIVVALIAVALLGAGAIMGTRRHRGIASLVPTDIRAPTGVRIRVQVLNATKTRGLARRATLLLRDRGFDVVEMGTTNESHDSTVVLDLSGHSEWAARAAGLFSPALVETRIDTSRYLDIAVLLGSTWRPPTEPFYP